MGLEFDFGMFFSVGCGFGIRAFMFWVGICLFLSLGFYSVGFGVGLGLGSCFKVSEHGIPRLRCLRPGTPITLSRFPEIYESAQSPSCLRGSLHGSCSGMVIRFRKRLQGLSAAPPQKKALPR